MIGVVIILFLLLLMVVLVLAETNGHPGCWFHREYNPYERGPWYYCKLCGKYSR